MKKQILFFLFAVLLVSMFVWLGKTHKPEVSTPTNITNLTELNKKQIKIAGQLLSVDIADTEAIREQGLSGRVSLTQDEGMLFVFESDGITPFWMKDMNFAIDIIWFDSDFRIVYIKKNATPESYPEVFSPSLESRYVLEVVSGFADMNELKVGDKMDILK